MTSLGGVSADKGAVLIAVDNIIRNLAVEEDDRDTGSFGGITGGLRRIRRRGLNDVDNQQVASVGDRGIDLVELVGLVVVAVVVLEGDAQLVELRIHVGAHAGDVDIREGVIEYAYIQVRRCRSRGFSRSRRGRRGFRRGRCGRRSRRRRRGGPGTAAARERGTDHCCCKDGSK